VGRTDRGEEIPVPTLPAWNALHPLVVHFPIALLLVVPLIIGVGIAGRAGRGVPGVAFLLLALGTGSAWLAVATGESAGQLAERLPGVARILDRHEELAEITRTLFTLLTLAYGGLLVIPRALHREPSPRTRIALHGGFLVLYLAALGPLVATAHQGGRLVHEKGVHALVPAGRPVDGAPGSIAGSGEQDAD
jgi:uncharacterized membrane protein